MLVHDPEFVRYENQNVSPTAGRYCSRHCLDHIPHLPAFSINRSTTTWAQEVAHNWKSSSSTQRISLEDLPAMDQAVRTHFFSAIRIEYYHNAGERKSCQRPP